MLKIVQFSRQYIQKPPRERCTNVIKAVICDVDGTLVDSVDAHTKAWCEAFEFFGHEIKFARMRHQIGKGADQLIPVFLSEQEIERFGKKLEEKRGHIFKQKYLPSVRAFPKVRDLFERLIADGKRVVLASSAKADELGVYKRLAHIEDLVEDETSQDDAEKSKPHPDIFKAALKKLKGVTAGEALALGDTPYDVIAARRAGIATIAVLSGGFPQEELAIAGCLDIYRDPADLLANYAEWIEGKEPKAVETR